MEKNSNHGFSPEEVQEFRETFKMFDKNQDGGISVSELKQVMSGLRQEVTDDEIKNMLTNITSDGRGTLDFDAFLHQMRRSMSAANSEEARRQAEQEMRQAFKVFDLDGNGLIDANELQKTMKSLGENLSKKDVKAMMKAADKNGDGKIDYEEFIKMMYAK